MRDARQPSSLLIFNHKTWHRGTPAGNRADGPRDIITNAYARPAIMKTQLLEPASPVGTHAHAPRNSTRLFFSRVLDCSVTAMLTA
jgi:hypothetical protein